MIKVTTIQKCFKDGAVYLYSERYHIIEYPDGTIEQSEKTLWELRKELPEFEKKVKTRVEQVSAFNH